MSQSDIMQYAFYTMIVLASGVGEYFHLVPSGTLTGALLLVSGHFFGMSPVKATVTQIASDVKGIASTTTTPSPVTVDQTPKFNG